MQFLDARRLTGPSLIFDGPGAILEVECTPQEADRLQPVWQRHVTKMRKALGWEAPQFASRKLLGGISLAFSAPIDALYAASEINEWAWAASAQELGVATTAPDFVETLAAIEKAIAAEANPQLLQLLLDAREHGVTALWDDDHVSLGLGRSSETWPVREIPADIDWKQYRDVPLAVITGTNGKTTTVRMARNIARTAGKNVGLSSTDWIAVNDKIIDRGDWSGPGGARAVLREQDVDVAILESARGGLLRRGLGVDRADAALITNIAEDHLGDFGSQSLDELLDVKWIVSKAVRESGRLILNADDALLRQKSAESNGELAWFSLDANSAFVQQRVAAGECVFALSDGQLQRVDGNGRQSICATKDIPLTLGGRARHNIANSLAAAALTHSLGFSLAEIRDGLVTMRQEENPGRCNVYRLNACKVLVDFAHNPAAMQALFDMAQALPARRRVLCFGQAGDRPDGLIREMTRNAWAIGLDRVIVSELADYHRGREYGEIFAVMRDELLACGATDDQIVHVEVELDALNNALDWAGEDDLVIMLALASSSEIQARLAALGAK